MVTMSLKTPKRANLSKYFIDFLSIVMGKKS